MSYQDIARLIPTMQSVNLLSHTLPKKKKKKNLIGDATGILVGTSFIQSEAALVGAL